MYFPVYNYSPYYYQPVMIQRGVAPYGYMQASDPFTVDTGKTPATLADFEKTLDTGRFQDRRILAENAYSYAIPDINQSIKGHCLVVPKRKVGSVCDLSPSELADSFQLARDCEEQIKKSYNNPNMQFKIEAYEPASVNHAHFHVLPVLTSGR